MVVKSMVMVDRVGMCCVYRTCEAKWERLQVRGLGLVEGQYYCYCCSSCCNYSYHYHNLTVTGRNTTTTTTTTTFYSPLLDRIAFWMPQRWGHDGIYPKGR